MIKGTRILMGGEATRVYGVINTIRTELMCDSFQEIILPALWEQETFVKKAGPEVLGQMYAFKDKGDRDICLIPEATAIIQQQYQESWSKYMPRPIKLQYVARCYRYERPQEGRYREFTQLGVEILGTNKEYTSTKAKEECLWQLKRIIEMFGLQDICTINTAVKRGLDYYIEDGFEVECPLLGAQKQIAGGGAYEGGIGFAIGIERFILALQKLKELDKEE